MRLQRARVQMCACQRCQRLGPAAKQALRLQRARVQMAPRHRRVRQTTSTCIASPAPPSASVAGNSTPARACLAARLRALRPSCVPRWRFAVLATLCMCWVSAVRVGVAAPSARAPSGVAWPASLLGPEPLTCAHLHARPLESHVPLRCWARPLTCAHLHARPPRSCGLALSAAAPRRPRPLGRLSSPAPPRRHPSASRLLQASSPRPG